MRLFFLSIFITACFIQGAISFAPSNANRARLTDSSSTLFLFFGNNKKNDAKAVTNSSKAKPQNPNNKKNVPKVKNTKAMKPKAVETTTNGPTGAAALFEGIAKGVRRPQYDWVTGKPVEKPVGFDWGAAYKKKAD